MSEPAPESPERIAEALRARIRDAGPVSVAAFMTEALFDPVAGFYATRDPLTAGRDFITAPEISQMFGEVIGLWTVQAWRDLGAPERLDLIELGPGSGAMMSDVLRVLRVAPDAMAAARVTLVEASAALKMVQGRTLAEAPVQVAWANALERVAPGPCVILANEFLDCLPVRQAVKSGGVWRERMIGLDPEDETRFAFVLGSALAGETDLIAPELLNAEEGSLVELRPGDAQMADALAERLHAAPGRALFIDYGPARPEPGDTLQAVREHEKVDPLALPGSADITARVDFAQFARACAAKGLEVHGPAPQARFLNGLGLEQRAAALVAKLSSEEAKRRVARQLHRLTDPGEMGDLFKVIAISSPGLPQPAGLDPWSEEN